MKGKTIKLSENNIIEHLHGLKVGKELLNQTLKFQITMENVDYIKTNILCRSKSVIIGEEDSCNILHNRMQNVLLNFYRSARMTTKQKNEAQIAHKHRTRCEQEPHGKAGKLNIGKTIPKLPEDKKCNTTNCL